ncbi:hypothetical protein [Microcystis phage Mwe-JY13]
MTKDTGGQAYPTKLYTEQGHPGGYDMGMTQRDWFAGQALAGLLAANATYGGKTNNHAALARDCYATADAMLAARQS